MNLQTLKKTQGKTVAGICFFNVIYLCKTETALTL